MLWHNLYSYRYKNCFSVFYFALFSDSHYAFFLVCSYDFYSVQYFFPIMIRMSSLNVGPFMDLKNNTSGMTWSFSSNSDFSERLL